jgi:hypothetical protein
MAFSMEATHEAQDIPSMDNVAFFRLVPSPPLLLLPAFSAVINDGGG